MSLTYGCFERSKKLEATFKDLVAVNPGDSENLQTLSKTMNSYFAGESTYYSGCTKCPTFKLNLSEAEATALCSYVLKVNEDDERKALEQIDSLAKKYSCQP
jgi:hypothetical protein